MISRIDLRGRQLDPADLRAVLPRAELDVEAALATVQPICAQVRSGGAGALRELSERFDGVRPTHLRVPAAALAAALAGLHAAGADALAQRAGARAARTEGGWVVLVEPQLSGPLSPQPSVPLSPQPSGPLSPVRGGEG